MNYKKGYLYLFNELTRLLENNACLQDEIIRIQQNAEELVIADPE